MMTSESTQQDRSSQWTAAKLLLTAALVSVLVLQLTGIVTLDSNSIILIALLCLLWISPIIEELQISEYLRIKMRTAETNLEISRIEAISRLGQKSLEVLIPDWEFKLLKDIATNEDFVRNTDVDMHLFYKDLYHLLQLGLIERVDKDIRIPANRGVQKVRDYYRITPLGEQYLDVRDSDGASVSNAKQESNPGAAV